MNRKLLSVFFSALVCSTLGHEHLRAHELQSRHHHRSHALGVHSARANSQQCSYVCPVPNPSPENTKPESALSLVFIKETRVYALVSVSLEVALILQIGEPIGLLVDGKTGVSVVINIDKQTVVHYPAGSNDNLWKRPQTLVEYLQTTLGPLTNVNNWKNGQSSKLSSVSKDVKQVIISLIKVIDYQIGSRAEINPDSVISTISVSLNALLQSRVVVELLLGKLESTLTVITGGLGKIVNLVIGLKAIEKNIQGGLTTLITSSTSISLLLAENSGFNTLIDLLFQVSARVDLTKVIGSLLQSPETLLGVAVQLDGGIYYGVSGITAVIYNIQLYAAKKISLEALIDILIQVQAENGHVKITKETWNNAINWYFILAQSQTSLYKTDSSWSSLNKFFQDIKQETLIINGINVSAIINVMIATSGSPSLNNLVKILIELRPVVALTRVVATLYFRLVWFVISGQGLVFVQALLPSITITIDFSSSVSILKQILAKVNVLQVLPYLLRLDIVGAITHLPVLGPILSALEEILKAVGIAAEVTVSSSLKAVGSIVGDLKDLILFGLGRGGKAPSDSGIAGLSILGGGISVTITSSWTSSVSWSSSNGGSSGPSGTTSQGGSSGSSTERSSIGVSSSSGGSSSGGSSSTPRGSSSGGGSSTSGGSSSGGGSSTPRASSSGGGSSTPRASSSGGGSSTSGGSSSGGSGSHSGGTSIGGGSSSTGGSSSGGSGSHSGGTSIGGGSSSSGGSSSGGSGSHSGGISIGGGAISGGGSSSGGSGSLSGGISIGGGASSGGGISSGGSGSHSGGSSIGGSASSGGQGSGGSSSGGSGSHSGGASIGGSSSSGGQGGSSSGGSGSHSGGISIGGGASSGGGGSSSGGSASHSGGISVGGSSSQGGSGSGGAGWSIGNLLGGGGGGSSSHRWSLF